MRRFRWVLLVVGLVTTAFAGCSCGSTSPEPPPGTETPQFDATRAFGDLTAQCGFGARTPGSEAHQHCQEWLVQQLQQSTESVSVQAFDDPLYLQTGTFQFANIIARFGQGEGGLLIGAHWDCRPWADQDPDPAKRQEPVLGACDGASGVAILLELARLFKQTPPPMPVTLVLFDAEDAGKTLGGYCVGSRYFAAHMGNIRPDRAIVVDMVGGTDLRLPKESNSIASDPAMVDLVWGAAARLGKTQFKSSVFGPITDDHLSLINEGIPSIDIIDLSYEYWHTTGDTPEHCSSESLGAVGDVLVSVIYEELSS